MLKLTYNVIMDGRTLQYSNIDLLFYIFFQFSPIVPLSILGIKKTNTILFILKICNGRSVNMMNIAQLKMDFYNSILVKLNEKTLYLTFK